jgi:uncharacterized protein (DUF1330 family)
MSWSRLSTVLAIAVIALIGAGVMSATRMLSTAQPKRAYVLVQVDVTNAEQYAGYVKVAPDIVAKYGGRYLARGGRTATLEGPPAKSRVVVLEFPSFEAAEQFYHSPEYTAAKKIRAGAAAAQWIVVEAM